MILQALHAYCLRKMRDPDPARRLPAAGLEEKEIPFILELAADGRLIGISDTRTQEGKKKIARRFLVPQGVKKTSGVAANLLWDTAEYVLGFDTKGKPERVAEQTAAFRRRVEEVAQRAPDDAGLQAVLAFLSSEPLAAAQGQSAWAEIAEANPLLSFRLASEDAVDLVCQRPAVVAAIASPSEPTAAAAQGLPCLITGGNAEPERLHSAIKGVWGAQTSGANIVSFNLDAFRSFGKEQGANAPVSPAAAFAYTTALNYLLTKGSHQRMQVGDASTVFWAQSEADADFENAFAAFFNDQHDDPDAHTAQVRALLGAVHSGRFGGTAGERRFFVLGLAPNAARISIRFWHAAPLAEVGERIQRWFDELDIAGGAKDPAYPSLFRLLTAVALQGKADNIPPNLGGDVMRAILSGTPFPALWLNAAVQRCRAEQRVTHLRAAAIKACLLRSHPLSPQEDPKAMLDRDNPNAAYRLGRLFAVLEKIQEEANPGLNATIRERYYGAASSTPVAVFTTLLRLKNHHLAKLTNRGRATNFEKLIGEITGGIADFPLHLPLPEQGRFALGYYHQRQDFFTKHEAADAGADPAVDAPAAAATPAQPSLI
ncbi:type I-C CRISPR-associated protein Cas8c/Csd1 [Sphaerotilus microaerophilus]|uniref:Type I-C CRISPR-associated protein Cas8c/Csd1 n=1 Tax=Sphaerotilus microaerophilus TaxID=2914710 RepID=A0ABM7YQJ1_9BURK|nr:type I-C CRISPR-associated protein Cas8c/Csd1 [Sphaerotilus sp. FB-5]BDI06812.1 type I-C CRISPR-associated protein Cas8c/Csd1 [Sphaerotilus sp. FB-5]